MINISKHFDVHDRDVTPEIYTLLFCGAFVELRANDTWYRIAPFGELYCKDERDGGGPWRNYDRTEYSKSSEDRFAERLKRGWSNCYHDQSAMKNLCENPCTCEYAIEQFKKWLKDRGVTKKDTLFVKIWW